MRFAKILCPVDFSPGSLQAVRIAVGVANQVDAQLVLMHAWYVAALTFSDLAYPGDLLQAMRDDAAKGLEQALGDAKRAGARNVTAKLGTGLPWMSIAEELEDGYDLVIIGTHGRTGVSRVLLGSVAEKVVRHAPCSVLVVRPDSPANPFEHVLCPVDFSDSSHQAMLMAAALVQRSRAVITLMHAIEIPLMWAGEPPMMPLVGDLDRRATARLDDWASELRGATDLAVYTQVRTGRAGAETLKMLEEMETIDLVVMGTHGRTGIKRALVGSVAEKVVRHARCPVLITRTQGD